MHAVVGSLDSLSHHGSSCAVPLIVDSIASSQYMCCSTDCGPCGQFPVHVLFHWLLTLWLVLGTHLCCSIDCGPSGQFSVHICAFPLIADLMASSQYKCPTNCGHYGQFSVHVLAHWLWTLWPVLGTCAVPLTMDPVASSQYIAVPQIVDHRACSQYMC